MRQLILTVLICAIFLVNCTPRGEISYEEGSITVSDGIELYYEKFGDGPKKILISGGMYYSPIFKQLANPERTLIIYDQRGRGRSSAIRDSTQLGWSQEVEDIESIRNYFKFDSINIVGWSYEGAIAALYANAYPRLINRIILINPLPVKKIPYWEKVIQTQQSRKPDDYDNKIQLIQNNFEKTGEIDTYIKEYYKAFHPLLLFNKNIIENFREDFYTCENERPDRVWSFSFPSILSSLGNWDFTAQLNELTTQALIIHGTYDAIPIESAKEWNTLSKNSRLWLINDAGHMPFVEKQEEVLSGINEFLNGTWTDKVIR